MAPEAVKAKFERMAAGMVNARPDLANELTATHRKMIELLLAGYTEPDVAERLVRSRHTVHDHVKRIYAHFDVSCRVQLALLFAVPQDAKTTN